MVHEDVHLTGDAEARSGGDVSGHWRERERVCGTDRV